MKIKEMTNKSILLLPAVSLLFLILKVTDILDGGWLLVLAPILALPAGLIVLTVIMAVILVLAKGVDLIRRK